MTQLYKKSNKNIIIQSLLLSPNLFNTIMEIEAGVVWACSILKRNKTNFEFLINGKKTIKRRHIRLHLTRYDLNYQITRNCKKERRDIK